MEIGDAVTYVDPVSHEHNALVTAVWGSNETPSLNIMYVSDDSAKTDPYGRQVERSTSVVHESNQHAHGNFWKM